jgi:sphinganine-1-phosphate aldolase
MPTKGYKESDILDKIVNYSKGCRKHYTDGGNASGTVYTADEGHWNFLAEIMKHCILTNPLHLDEFAYVTQCEAEILRWTIELYNGDQEANGIVTSGGTESIILCMLAYREKAKEEKNVTKPNFVCSETAHCAFDKAAFYFGLEIRKIPVTKDFKADLAGMAKAIDSNTICLVASCPEYAFGQYDPAVEIGALAQSWGIGCHSDCCLGSYINPFAEELGYKLPTTVDFRVPGITSISCDPHKYAYGPKGCSLALFRDKQLREYQFFANTTWQGGIYATTCIAGSRPGSVIVGTWASMLKHGKEG